MKVMMLLSCLLAACAANERVGTTAQAESGCFNGVDSYTDENGDVIECVYTEEPAIDICFEYPQLCNPDPCDLDPSACTGGGDPGTGGGTTSQSCSAPSAAQDADYQRAKTHALCVLRLPDCAIILETAEESDPSALLSYLDLHGSVHENCTPDPDDPYIAATTYGTGNTAEIWLRPLYYSVYTHVGQVQTLLHELGHATGRIPGSHTNNYPDDPRTEQGWDDWIHSHCILNRDTAKTCGDPGTW